MEGTTSHLLIPGLNLGTQDYTCRVEESVVDSTPNAPLSWKLNLHRQGEEVDKSSWGRVFVDSRTVSFKPNHRRTSVYSTDVVLLYPKLIRRLQRVGTTDSTKEVNTGVGRLKPTHLITKTWSPKQIRREITRVRNDFRILRNERTWPRIHLGTFETQNPPLSDRWTFRIPSLI